MDSRYIGATEAAWRLLQFPLHGKSHQVDRRPVHLPLEQHLLFTSKGQLVVTTSDGSNKGQVDKEQKQERKHETLPLPPPPPAPWARPPPKWPWGKCRWLFRPCSCVQPRHRGYCIMCLRNRCEIEDVDFFRREVDNVDEVDCYDIEDIDVDNADEVDDNMIVAERRPTQAPI